MTSCSAPTPTCTSTRYIASENDTTCIVRSGGGGDKTLTEAETTVATATTIHGLKQELQRCLVMYGAKREQLSETSASLLEARNSLEQLQQRLERTDKELKETKVSASS